MRISAAWTLGGIALLAAVVVAAVIGSDAATTSLADVGDAFAALDEHDAETPIPEEIAEVGDLQGRSVEASASTPLPGGGVAHLIATDDGLLCLASRADLGSHGDVAHVSCDKASTATRDGMHSGLFVGGEGRALAVFPDGYTDSLSASSAEGGQPTVARTEVANLVAVEEQHLQAALRSGSERVIVRAEGVAGSMAVEIPIAVEAVQEELD